MPGTPPISWRLTGNYSFVDNNFFENLKYLHSEGGADVALNAPRHKAKLGADYDFGRWGLSAGGRVRYTGAFPMSSGVFVGDVDSYTVLDLNLAWRLPLEQDLVLRVDVEQCAGRGLPGVRRRPGGGAAGLRAAGVPVLKGQGVREERGVALAAPRFFCPMRIPEKIAPPIC